MIDYPFDTEKIKGLFLQRKNRFLITASVDGRICDCYLANPGRLWELLIPHETELILVKNTDYRKLPFTVLACKKNGNTILLHTHLTSRVVKALINDNKLPFYIGFKAVSEEVRLGSSRIDLLIEGNGERIYLEVKTCTLFGKNSAMFPDAVTQRGRKHLMELKSEALKGLKTSVLFVVMNPQVEYFLPAYHIDYEFAKAFMDVKDIVEIKAIALGWDSSFTYVRSIKELKIPYSFIDKVLDDRGVYILVNFLEKPELLNIGKLGDKVFPTGYYVYVGSAKRGLFKRIGRHRRKIKRMHWHIDYFLSKARIIKDFPIVTDRNIECAVAEHLSKICDEVIPHFGSSDCRCGSHLFYFRENPINHHEFIEMLNYFRIDALDLH